MHVFVDPIEIVTEWKKRPFPLVTDMSTRILEPASRDGNALADSLRTNHPGVRALPAQAHARSDRVQTSIYALEKIMESEAKKEGGKLLVWVSPGWPFLFAVNVDLTEKEQLRNPDKVVDDCTRHHLRLERCTANGWKIFRKYRAQKPKSDFELSQR